MSRITRREFITKSAIGVAGLSAASWARVLGANDAIRVGVVGVRGQGFGHVKMLSKIEGVRIVALCDADRDVLEGRAKDAKAITGQEVRKYQDMRKMMEDKEIDAISTATPNHWHSLLTIWACQAGKDVYVEKPVSHNIWEGRKMVEAARKYNRIVQAGTQKRSTRAMYELMDFINSGELGKIKWVRGICHRDRKSIGKVDGPQEPPKSVDYSLWTGPAPLKPLMRKRLHYDWHWVWDTGNGDMGNQGIHEMDLSRWALGDPGFPTSVMSIGGRLGYDDDGETANTHVCFFDYEKAPLIFETKGLDVKKGTNARPHYRGVRVGFVIQCEGGHWAGQGDGGGWVYDNDGKKIRQFKSGGAGKHMEVWIKAVRSRKLEDLTADIEICHISSGLCHMGNISHRLGETMKTRKIKKAIRKNDDMKDSLDRMLEHLDANEVDLKKTPLTLGPVLQFDPAAEKFVGEHSEKANELVTRKYRQPFVVPEQV